MSKFYKAVFKEHFTHKTKNQFHLLTVISIDQEYQRDEQFLAFCEAINQRQSTHPDELEKLTVVETGFLKRHYTRLYCGYPKTDEGLELAAQKGRELGLIWRQGQQNFLETLEIPYEILSWESLVETPEFKEGLSKVMVDYGTDKVFKPKVDGTAKEHAFKLFDRIRKEFNQNVNFEDCVEACKDYLLEESAIYFALVGKFDFITYPGYGNNALKHVYKKYFAKDNPLPWVRYEIIDLVKQNEKDSRKLEKKASPIKEEKQELKQKDCKGQNSSSNGHSKGLGFFVGQQLNQQNSNFNQGLLGTINTLPLEGEKSIYFAKEFMQLFLTVVSKDLNEDQAKIVTAQLIYALSSTLSAEQQQVVMIESIKLLSNIFSNNYQNKENKELTESLVNDEKQGNSTRSAVTPS